MEMRDKAGAWLDELSPESDALSQGDGITAPSIDQRAEAEQALVALGYKLTEAAKLIASTDAAADASSQELIRLALRIAGGAKG